MRGGADSRRTSPAALIPIAATALIVLVVALSVRGGEQGTIVVERSVFSAITTQNGRTGRPRPFVIDTITETAADGALQRELTSNSFARPGFQTVLAGQTVELYDPLDRTVYETTLGAVQRAIEGQQSPSAGRHSVSRVVQIGTHGVPSVAGRHSIFEQRLGAGLYRVAARVRFDGRAALKLVPTRVNALIPAHGLANAELLTGTAYVSPETYAPIEVVSNLRLPGVRSTMRQRWLSYRVLAATGANERLLSLTALHPGARVIRNAAAFLRAAQSEQRPLHVRVLGGGTLAGA